MAQIGRARLLPLLCSTRQLRQPRQVPGSSVGVLVAQPLPSEPTVPPVVSYAYAGLPLATAATRAAPLSRRSLRRSPSAIRTGCANERPSRSEEGVASNRDPYSDLTFVAEYLRGNRIGEGSEETALLLAFTCGQTSSQSDRDCASQGSLPPAKFGRGPDALAQRSG
jgi:hypothetical protein